MKNATTETASEEGDYAPYEVVSPTKHHPSAPMASPVKYQDAPIGTAVPVVHDPLPPSSIGKLGFVKLTLKLIPYHILNFTLGTSAFCIVVTAAPLAIGLLPICGLGIVVYIVLLYCVRLMVIMDIMLANSITRSQAAIVWNVPDELETEPSTVHHIRIAPRLNKLSVRSTVALLYFATVKFALGIVSCVVVCIPFLPIASEIVSHTAKTEDTNVAGFPVHKFNLSTDPELYVLTCVGYIVVGVFLMHFFARVSRETTRRVVCKEILSTAAHIAV